MMFFKAIQGHRVRIYIAVIPREHIRYRDERRIAYKDCLVSRCPHTCTLYVAMSKLFGHQGDFCAVNHGNYHSHWRDKKIDLE